MGEKGDNRNIEESQEQKNKRDKKCKRYKRKTASTQEGAAYSSHHTLDWISAAFSMASDNISRVNSRRSDFSVYGILRIVFNSLRPGVRVYYLIYHESNNLYSCKSYYDFYIRPADRGMVSDVL
ncbi:MAG: hypothetical protein HUJ70_08070 [Pseudobutyrivibrio sp.]|nr:hypothetical protein [Pseudobutyrivibrio sp.]